MYSLGGSVLNYYIRMDSNDFRPQLRADADRLGGINVTTDDQLIEALKTIPTSVLLEYTYNNGSSQRTRLPSWAPVIESVWFIFFKLFELKWNLSNISNAIIHFGT